MIREISSRQIKLLPFVFCALLIIGAIEAQATIMKFLEVEDLTRISSHIFHGQVIATDSYWNAERTAIYTDIKVQIKEAFKGSLSPGEIVTITQLGGEKDGVLLDFEGRPQFSVGESVVLFTTRGRNSNLTVVALKQGKMQVEGSEVVRDFSGIILVEKTSRGKGLQAIQPRQTRLTLDELRSRIASAK